MGCARIALLVLAALLAAPVPAGAGRTDELLAEADAARLRTRERLAERSPADAELMIEIGQMYQDGRGTPRDDAAAARWYRKAADLGDPEGQHKLGGMYYLGSDVSRDYREALGWFVKAANQGLASAQYLLGTMYFKGQGVAQDHANAVFWMRKAADQGYADAQRDLGVMYEFGHGVAENKEEAVRWYRMAAVQGHAAGQTHLGVMYLNGYGVPKNYDLAARHMREAADQGYPEAQKNLGIMYELGHGVPRDREEAIRWYRKAMSQGSVYARKGLQRLGAPLEIEASRPAAPGARAAAAPSRAGAAPSRTRPRPPARRGGCIEGNCRNGTGTHLWPSGNRYVGTWKNGRPHDHGTLIYAAGGSYAGAWSEGKRSGEGTETRPDGRVYAGVWENDRLVRGLGDSATSTGPRWPSLAEPAATVGGGERDAALVVGVEHYAHVAEIPGASENAAAWYDYLVKTRKVPVENATLLLDGDATVEELRRAAVRTAGQAEESGTLWFVFIGHGAPSADAKDGLLVGFDAQQKARSIEERSLPQAELLRTLESSEASRIHVLFDTCFSGRSGSGRQLVAGLQPLVVRSLRSSRDPRTTLFTAGRGDEFAGPLPGAARPAFSYLALGGLRGWADTNRNGQITAGELHGYVSRAMQAVVHDRTQRPTFRGAGSVTLARSPREKAPDLAALVVESARGGAR